MILDYIKINNFRNYKDSKINFNKGLNVFVGTNSSGKTNLFSLLKFISYIFDGGDIGFAFNKINRNFLNLKRNNEEGLLNIKIKVDSVLVLKINKEEYGIIENNYLLLELKFKEIDGEMFISDFKGTIGYKFGKSNKKPGKKPPKISSKLQKLEILNKVQYYNYIPFIINLLHGNEEKRDDIIEKFKCNEVKNINNNISNNELENRNFKLGFLNAIKPFLGNLKIHFININPIEARKPISLGETDNEPSMLSENGNNLPIFLSKILKDKKNKELFDEFIDIDLPYISSVSTHSDSKTGYNFIAIKEDESDVKPTWISDGTINYLAYLSIIVGLNKNNGTILCIEEIERNLHYKLLSNLIGRFKNELTSKGIQLFITSHSMNLLNSLRPEEVFLLKRNGGLTKIEEVSKIKEINKLIEIASGLGNLFFDNEINYE